MMASMRLTALDQSLCFQNGQQRPNFRGPSQTKCRVHQTVAAYATASSGPKKVIVIGGGFAGFGAAKHLAEQGYNVTLLDGAENPGGLSAGWRTPQGRAVEAGIKGFWYQSGPQAASGAPVVSLLKHLSSPQNPGCLPWLDSLCTQLPSSGAMLAEISKLRLPLEERATMLPWLWSVLDVNSSPEVYARYDKMTAKELFQRFNVSERMYNEFLRPTLLVGLFAPPEDLSAAAVLNTLYFYALAHQADFDVCWCKGSVSERIFLPLVEKIKQAGAKIQGSTFVTDIAVDAMGRVKGVTAKQKGGKTQQLEADAVIFAIGVTGMQKLVAGSKELSKWPEFKAVSQLKSIDVISVRLWFDRKIAFKYPANVLAGFENQAGSTFFDLNTLQEEYRDEKGSVVGSDFYGATELLGLSDAQIVDKVVRNITRCEPALKGAKVVDSAVLKFPRAVTHFSPGSHAFMPEQTTSLPNLFIAGDWVKNIEHGANGLSQERAYVTGLRAANFVVDELNFGEKADILPVEADEPHITFGKAANKSLRLLLNSVGLEKALLP